MTIVDNNVLSAIAKRERLALFPDVFATVGTPMAVVAELDRAEAAGTNSCLVSMRPNPTTTDG